MEYSWFRNCYHFLFAHHPRRIQLGEPKRTEEFESPEAFKDDFLNSGIEANTGSPFFSDSSVVKCVRDWNIFLHNFCDCWPAVVRRIHEKKVHWNRIWLQPAPLQRVLFLVLLHFERRLSNELHMREIKREYFLEPSVFRHFWLQLH